MSTAALSSVSTDRKLGRAKPLAKGETPADLADKFGALKARIAEIQATAEPLEVEAEEIRKKLVALGQEAINGSAYRVTVSHTLRIALDPKLVKESMPEAWIAKHSKSTPVTTVRVGGLLVRS